MSHRDGKGSPGSLEKGKDLARKAVGKALGLPFRGVGLTLKALFGPLLKKHPWVLALLLLLPLAFLGPVATLLAKFLDGLGALLKPLVESPLGRFLLLNATLLLLVWIAWRLLKNRVTRLVGTYVLGRYMEGLSFLLKGERKQAVKRFKSALRWCAFIDPARAVPELPHVKGEISLRLAYLALEDKRSNEALRSLLRIRPADFPKPFRSTYRELLARAYATHPTLGRDAVDQKIEEILEEDPGDPAVLRLLRERKEEQGEWVRAAQAQEKVAALQKGEDQERERRKLAVLWLQAAKEAQAGGDLDLAWEYGTKARKAWPGLEQVQVFLGDLLLEKGKQEKALRLWAEAPGLPSLERVERLVSEGRVGEEGGGRLSPRELARTFPQAGVLVVLARYWAGKGELRKAHRALLRLEELGERSPRILTLHAAVLEQMGEKEEASRVCREALSRLLGLNPDSS